MNFTIRNVAPVSIIAVALAALTACGGDSTPTKPPPGPTYSISGTVSGVGAGQSILLHDNGGDNLTVSANGAFTFANKIASGGAYAVTVSPPAGMTCTVTGGVGTASANISSVAVACVPTSAHGLTVGGPVSGLVGQGLVLRLGYHVTDPYSGRIHPLQDLAINGNGNFAFTPLDPRSDLKYGVGIVQQPHSPAQRCVVRSRYASFSITANVADVGVVCGEFLYVANAAANTISAFAIDPATGALASAGTPVTAGSSPRAIAGSSDRRFLYVGNSGSNDVSAFAIDPSSGRLTTVPGSPFAAGTNPRALLLFESNYLSFESTLVVANAGSNDLSVYNVDRGTGVPAPHASYATGAGPSAMVSRLGYNSVLLVAGSNDISVFAIGGALEHEPAAPYPSGGSVSSLAFGASANGADLFVYAANATGGAATISGFNFNVLSFYADGAWTSLPGFPYALPSCSSIVADQNGTYLYATAGTNLLGYIIDKQTGALSPLPNFPIAVGAKADAVIIDPSNQFLYVRNGSAGKVTGFALNAATGALTPMPGSPFSVGAAADFFGVF